MATDDCSIPSLERLCLCAAIASDHWQLQRRCVAALPEAAANALLAALIAQGRLRPPQLHLFQHSATRVALSTAAGPPGPWVAHVAAFRHLQSLNLSGLRQLKDASLALLPPLAPSLQSLRLRGCAALTPRALPHVAALTSLTRLDASESGLGGGVLAAVAPSLQQLARLDLGGLPTPDAALHCAAALSALSRLEVWGSVLVTDAGLQALCALASLRQLHVAWTAARRVPALPQLLHLHMAHCVLGGEEVDGLHGDLPSLATLQLPHAALRPPEGAHMVRALVHASLPSLTLLDVGHVEGLGDAAGLLPSPAPHLRALDLTGGDVSLEAMAAIAEHAPALTRLVVSGSSLTLASLAQLMGHPSLANLSARSCLGLAPAAAAETHSSPLPFAVLLQLPRLVFADFSHIPRLDVLAPAELQQRDDAGCVLATLTGLRLDGCDLSGGGCHALRRLAPMLIQVSVGGSALGDGGVAVLGSLPALQELALCGCPRVTAVGVEAAAHAAAARHIGRLQVLELCDCPLVAANAGAELVAEGLVGVVTVDGERVGAGGTRAAAGAGNRGASRGVGPGLRAAVPVLGECNKHDQRIRYSREEMCALRGSGSSGTDSLLAMVPPELALPCDDDNSATGQPGTE